MENGTYDNIWLIHHQGGTDRPAAGSGPFHQAIGVGVGVQAIACHGKSALIESMDKEKPSPTDQIKMDGKQQLITKHHPPK